MIKNSFTCGPDQVSRFNSWPLTPASCQCRAWEAAVMAQAVGFLPLMFEIWMEFARPNPSHCRHLGREQHMSFLFLFLSLNTIKNNIGLVFPVLFAFLMELTRKWKASWRLAVYFCWSLFYLLTSVLEQIPIIFHWSPLSLPWPGSGVAI